MGLTTVPLFVTALFGAARLALNLPTHQRPEPVTVDLIVNADTGGLIRSLDGHAGPVVEAACGRLPDGRLVAVTLDHTGELRVWDLSTGAVRTRGRRNSCAARRAA